MSRRNFCIVYFLHDHVDTFCLINVLSVSDFYVHLRWIELSLYSSPFMSQSSPGVLPLFIQHLL